MSQITFYLTISVREHRRDNQKWTIHRTGNIVYTRRRKTKQKHNTICVRRHNTQTNTNNVIKTGAILQTTGGKDEPNIVLCGNRIEHHNTELRRVRTHNRPTQKQTTNIRHPITWENYLKLTKTLY